MTGEITLMIQILFFGGSGLIIEGLLYKIIPWLIEVGTQSTAEQTY